MSRYLSDEEQIEVLISKGKLQAEGGTLGVALRTLARVHNIAQIMREL